MSIERVNKSILIFTDKYPYGKGETFFELELKFLSNIFETVTILPLERTASASCRTYPHNVKVLNPPFISVKNKLELLRKGLFNRSEVLSFFRELFVSKAFFSAAKFRNWFVHFLVVRAELAFLELKRDTVRMEVYDIRFFYWGLRWSQVLPFIPDSSAKTVVRFHGSDLYNERNNNYIPFRKEQLNKIDLAVFISEMGQAYLKQRYAQILKNTVVARLGTEDFGLGPLNKGKIHIVSCSNIVPLKQIDKIALALNHLKTEVTWTHLGDGPLRSMIQKIVHPATEVIFKGHLSHDELMAYYQNHPVDLFINTSSSEGIPVSVMEALSFGIPVIATNVGGTAEIVDGDVGLLISPDITPIELAKAIDGFLNLDNHKKLRSNARKRWEDRCQANSLYAEFARLLHHL